MDKKIKKEKINYLRDLINGQNNLLVVCVFSRIFLKMTIKEIADSRKISERTVYNLLAKSKKVEEEINKIDCLYELMNGFN